MPHDADAFGRQRSRFEALKLDRIRTRALGFLDKPQRVLDQATMITRDFGDDLWNSACCDRSG